MIRQAIPDDVSGVADLVHAAYQHYVAIIGTAPGPMLDDYATRVAAGQTWVLQDDTAIAGVLVLENGPDCFLLDNIAIRPDRQGRGYGRLLLDFAEAEARRCGWKDITLYTNALMTENLLIYAARGYVEHERRSEKGFSRVYMVKHLT
jgi:GNAT superfamily N-acetyltransferase